MTLRRREVLKIGGLMGMSIWQKEILKKDRRREKFFPLFEISAQDYQELGYKIGEKTRNRIKASLQRRKKWLKDLTDFAQADRKTRFEPFLASLQENFPHYYEELKGMAQGAGVDFELLFILNLNPELSAMMRSAREEDCSTVLVKSGERIILGHNEDGSEQYLDLMSLLRVKAPSGIEFFVLSYPGIMMGNGPGINNKGLVHTCNYIGSKKFQPGVPRYFLDRAMLEAESIGDAIKIASHPARAYSQAHNLVSLLEKRALMIESSIFKVALKEIEGISYRTNNYILPEMEDEPQFASYQLSSLPRLKSLELFLKELKPQQIDSEKIIQSLSNHNTPFISPCRHKTKIGLGATLGMLLLDSSEPDFKIFYQMPCQNVFKKFPRPI